MRYDIQVLWIEDTAKFYEEAKDILEMYAEDLGLTINFNYVENVDLFMKRIDQEKKGFKIYDMFFVDYSLSAKTTVDGKSIVGSNVIRELRKRDVDSDILFYSSENEGDIRDIVAGDLSSYEGVYIANRKNFRDKSHYLLEKNAKKLLSLANIRGVLMDHTSENDYTVKSYILRKFDKLTPDQKIDISNCILTFIKDKSNDFKEHTENLIAKLEKENITNIKKLMNEMDELVPIKLKYEVFQMMANFNQENAFKKYSIEQYLSEIVTSRNKLAHKKLDVCKTQKYILYYDDINQYESRQCPDDCVKHDDNNKISISSWNDLRKNIVKFGKEINLIQKDL